MLDNTVKIAILSLKYIVVITIYNYKTLRYFLCCIFVTMKNFVLISLLAISSSLFAGGPWLTPKKSGFLQLQTTIPAGAYNSLFLNDKSSNSIINRPALDFNFQGFLEYGISDNFNVIAVLPYKIISTGDVVGDTVSTTTLLPKGTLTGFSNPRLAFKYRISKKYVNAAVSVQSTFNVTRSDLSRGLATGYAANSIGLFAHIGKSFTKDFYSFIEGGYNVASNNFSSFLEIHYEIAYQFDTNLWGAFTLDVRETFEDGSFRNDNLRQTAFYTNDQEFFAFGLKFSYDLDSGLGFSGATFGAFSGNFVAKVGTFSFGVHKKF